jgi:hypothetical protein
LGLAIVAALAYPAASQWYAAAHASGMQNLLPLAGLGVVGMVVIPWQPALTREELDLLVNPQSAGLPECMPWQLFDTQSIATAATGPFTFFSALNNDKTLSNVESAGSFPDPQYMVIHYVACDILQALTATALANEPNGNAAAIENLVKTVRATFTLTISNKNYGPFSLTTAHATGGTTGFGYGYGTAANGTSLAVVNNGVPGSGGFPFGGAIIIPPKVNYALTVNLSAACTLAATVNMRISLFGVLYRRVL